MGKYLVVGALLFAILAVSPGTQAAQNKKEGPPNRIQQLQEEVKALKAQLKLVEQQVKQIRKDSQQTHAIAEKAQTGANVAQSQVEGVRASALALASEVNDRDIKYRLAGSVVANWTDPTSKSAPSSFMGGSFMPIFLVRYKNLLELESHMEVKNNGNGTDVSLEYAQLDLFLNDYMTLVAGKFLSPVGQFQQALHPAWINKLPDRPAGFVEGGGGEPLSEVGIQLTGAVPVGSMALDYAVFTGNGPQLTSEGLTLEGFSKDNNKNKAFGGRIGLRPFAFFDVGVSAMQAQVLTNVSQWSGAGKQAGFNLVGADFSYTPGMVELRGEYIRSQLKPVLFDDGSGSPPQLTPDTHWNLWYLQGSYRLANIFPDSSMRNLELIIRRSHIKVSGGVEDWRMANENRTTLGVDYWFGPTLVAKFAYEHKLFQNQPNDNVLRAQLAFGF